MLQLGDVHDDGGTSPASPSCWFIYIYIDVYILN